jgi:glycosyltransferase involved in cell wall biosynthesis
MKICMFTNTYLPHVGGVARSIETFSHDLRDMGHRVLIVAPVYENDTGDYQDEGEILRLPAIQNFNGSDFSLHLPVPFLVDEKLDEFDPDIFHSHHPYLLGDTALRAARKRGRPLVFTHHTLYENYTHYVSLDSKPMRRFVISLSTEYANMCTKVIAPSRSVADLISERGVTSPIEEIPTGVDLAFFASGKRETIRKDRGWTDNIPVIGHVGRLAPEKNLEYLAEAMALALENNEQAVFLVVGGGPSEETVKNIFSSRGLDRRLVMIGQKTGVDLADAYAAMDLFVFTSRTETQGLVLTEAMAAGKPVVALDASGTREVVRDGRNGRLLPADTAAEEFAAAVSELCADRKLLAAYGRDAHTTAKSFSREACAKKLVDLYQSLSQDYSPRRLEEIEDQQPWFSILEVLKAEWELIAEKTTAAVEAFNNDDDEVSLD